jgi:hypothetical protein
LNLNKNFNLSQNLFKKVSSKGRSLINDNFDCGQNMTVIKNYNEEVDLKVLKDLEKEK